MSVRRLLDEYIDQEKLYGTEGESAIKNLCRIARALGYKDTMYFGQLEHNACVGDFLEFLKDNSGCVEAIREWIRKQKSTEWEENIESQLNERENEETDEDEED